MRRQDGSRLSSLPTSLVGRTVLQIIPQLDAGGAERTTIDGAAALAEAGARPLVATLGGRLISELQANGGVWAPFPARTKNPLAMALNVRRLARIIRDEKVDLVHARSRAPAWVALGAARLTNTPFVTTYHGSYAGQSILKVLYNSVMARGDAVIANSQFTADRILRMHPFAADRIHVIHRGTDFRAFTPAQVDAERVSRLRKSWGLAPDDRIVLLAARLTGWKGQRVLIEAAKLLVAQGLTDTKFVLAGDDQGRDAYVRELRGRIADSVMRIGESLRDDTELRDKVDNWIVRGARHLVEQYGGEATAIITDTIERWDADEASRRIELHVGRDLQFIRINGTVVGAVAGLVIYAIGQLLF